MRNVFFHSKGGNFIDMNQVNITYNNLLGKSIETQVNYKRYSKNLLKENFRDIFSRPKSRRQSQVLCSNSSHDDYNLIFKTASMIRKDILDKEKWVFKGDFNEYELPKSLKSLLQSIIIGPKSNIDLAPFKKESVDIAVRNIGEIIMNSVKTKKQVTYNSAGASFRDSVETSFIVVLGLYMHQQTRSKKVINTLSALKQSIPYDKLLQIETSMASAIADNMDKNEGVFLPSNICKGSPIQFAIDNKDFANDTLDGKREFHGTGQVVFQKNNKGQVIIKIERSNKKTFKSNIFKVHSHCFKPTPQMKHSTISV